MDGSDLRHTAGHAVAALRPALDLDWSAAAEGLDWSCRRTLDHIADALVLYAAHLAMRAPERLPFLRDGNPGAEVEALLGGVPVAAAILAELVDAAPAGTRAFHPAGMADPSGFAAMGCDEIAIHTHDIASGLGIPYRPPSEVCEAVIGRLFPWAPDGDDPWLTLLWLNGRGELGSRSRLDADWWWHCAPLDEWDGTVKRRTSPPAW